MKQMYREYVIRAWQQYMLGLLRYDDETLLMTFSGHLQQKKWRGEGYAPSLYTLRNRIDLPMQNYNGRAVRTMLKYICSV